MQATSFMIYLIYQINVPIYQIYLIENIEKSRPFGRAQMFWQTPSFIKGTAFGGIELQNRAKTRAFQPSNGSWPMQNQWCRIIISFSPVMFTKSAFCPYYCSGMM
jgi:hypothetical protein